MVYDIHEIKTLFAGKAWVHEKYLRSAMISKTTGIQLIYNGKKMSIPPEQIHPSFWQKGDRPFNNKFGGGTYYLWGITFKEDDTRKYNTKV